ncbi:rubredoxin [Dunaliella salina]|uniref:Rubredoxin n=1 Tax=Dunaliella salina TaxID=3046 RepID=A0ABQ7GX95_DUNSA|nr:rubredoxin [Dunaliella salina]|eukprot:KAF5839231.1 rubredoxin [Dunaliella salina]
MCLHACVYVLACAARRRPVAVAAKDDSETAKRQAEAERLRQAEQFMVVGGGNGTCQSCGYNYSADKGDPEFPVARGTKFEELPKEYTCPVCNAPKSQFKSDARVLAGFAENQKYGLGFNSVTGNQKLLVIYGALVIGFILLISGYAME